MEECQIFRSKEAIQLRAIAMRFLMSCSLDQSYAHTQRNFVADFLQAKCDLRWKTAVLRF